jgi:hypothetical protein
MVSNNTFTGRELGFSANTEVEKKKTASTVCVFIYFSVANSKMPQAE